MEKYVKIDGVYRQKSTSPIVIDFRAATAYSDGQTFICAFDVGSRTFFVTIRRRRSENRTVAHLYSQRKRQKIFWP